MFSKNLHEVRNRKWKAKKLFSYRNESIVMILLSFSERIKVSRGIVLSWSCLPLQSGPAASEGEVSWRRMKLQALLDLTAATSHTSQAGTSSKYMYCHRKQTCRWVHVCWELVLWWITCMRSSLFPPHPSTRNGNNDQLETLELCNFTDNQLFKTVMTAFMQQCVFVNNYVLVH